MAIYYLPQYKTTALNVPSGIDDSQTTGIIIANVDGIDITKAGILCITYDTPVDTTVAEYVSYTSINGSNELQGVTRGAEGISAKTHENNAVIGFIISKSHINAIADHVLTEHNSDGTHSDITADSITVDTVTADTSVDTPILRIAGGTAMASVKDEDDMSSDSNTAFATQQSIKAYVDLTPLRYMCLARTSGNQALTGGATTIVQLATEQYDPNSNFDTGTYKYTVPVTGYYTVSGNLRFTGVTAGSDTMQVLIYRDAAYIAITEVKAGTSVTAGRLQVTKLDKFTAGQTISLYGYNTNNCTLSAGAGDCWMSVKFEGV